MRPSRGRQEGCPAAGTQGPTRWKPAANIGTISTCSYTERRVGDAGRLAEITFTVSRR